MSEEKKYCLCGCGAEVNNKWVRGHHSRVNNISKRADIKEKRRKSMKQRHKDGIMPQAWNKGKTAKDDDRLRKAGEKWKENLTDEGRKGLSSRMKKAWEDGKITPQTGEDHSNWKGGTSSITHRIRGSGKLYRSWKRPIMEKDGFKCVLCSKGSDKISLVIHHYEERMHTIIKKFLPEDLHELSWGEEATVVNAVEKYHVDNDVLGVTLCKTCHDMVHRMEKIDEEMKVNFSGMYAAKRNNDQDTVVEIFVDKVLKFA